MKLDLCNLVAYPGQWGERDEWGELRRLCMAPATRFVGDGSSEDTSRKYTVPWYSPRSSSHCVNRDNKEPLGTSKDNRCDDPSPHVPR